MSVTQQIPSPLEGEGGAQRRMRGLSEHTQQLWLAAVRHRALADAIAVAAARPAQ